MKIPFYTILRPSLRRNHRILKKICSYPLLNVSVPYATFLGLLGTVLSLFDIVRIINCGSTLPSSLRRDRIKTGKIVSAQCERDLKLTSLVVSSEYYLLLIFGTITQNPIFYLPWLLLYALIIILEFVVFVIKLFNEGFNVTKRELLLTMFIIYNWFAICCAFLQLIDGCDF